MRALIALAALAVLTAPAAAGRFADSASHYDVLGITRDADAKAVRSAYRAVSLETHPDRGGDPDDFVRVAAAYEVLSDDAKRRRYDTELRFSSVGRAHRGGGSARGGGQRDSRPWNDPQRKAERMARAQRGWDERSQRTAHEVFECSGKSQEELLREAMRQFSEFSEEFFDDFIEGGKLDSFIDDAIDKMTFGGAEPEDKPSLFSLKGVTQRAGNSALKMAAKSAMRVGGEGVREALREGMSKLKVGASGDKRARTTKRSADRRLKDAHRSAKSGDTREAAGARAHAGDL